MSIYRITRWGGAPHEGRYEYKADTLGASRAGHWGLRATLDNARMLDPTIKVDDLILVEKSSVPGKWLAIQIQRCTHVWDDGVVKRCRLKLELGQR